MERTEQQELRNKLADDVHAFLSRGGKITQCPQGKTALDNEKFVAEAKEALSKISGEAKKKGGNKKPHNKIDEKDPRYPVPGKRYGKLTIVSTTFNFCGHRAWICDCDCGKRTGPIPTSKLVNGLRKSCGCKRFRNTRKKGKP